MHIRTILFGITLAEILLGFVDVVLCVVVLGSTLLGLGIFQHEIELRDVTNEEDVAIGLLGAVVDFEHIAVGHAILIDLDLFAEVVVTQMFAIEHQLNRLTTLLPAEGGVLLRHKEGQIGTHHRLIVPACQQHPTLVFGHTEHFGLLAELDCVGFLGVAPRGIATTLDLGVSLSKECITIAVVDHHLGRNPRIFILDCLVILSIDHHNGQTRQTLITDFEFDRYGRCLAIQSDTIYKGLREINSSFATDLRLSLCHHTTAFGNGEGRNQRRTIDIIGNLATEHAIAIDSEGQILSQCGVLSFVDREGAEGHSLRSGRCGRRRRLRIARHKKHNRT